MEELKELVKQIEAAKEAYYGSGRTLMSDEQYDKLVNRAEKLGYIETVGSAPVSELPKIKHEHLMLSLDKVHTAEEVKSFASRHGVLAMYKCDGLSISATYQDGVLTRLETRGNGEVGNDIMVHAKSFENLPLIIDKDGKYVVDGECVILYKDFDEINSKLLENEKYKNPRNLAAGSLNLIDSNISAKRHLRFYVWDVIEGGVNQSLLDCLDEAANWFDVVTHHWRDGAKNLMDSINYFQKRSKEEGFPIDGVVVKYDDMALRESLGYTGHHFRNACAYKFEDERVESTIRSCEFQIGKTGQLTPVLIFDPVDISGSVVEKASAHNISILKQLNPKIGCTCYIYKANDIIPQVDACDDDGTQEIEIPKVCPVCGKPTRIVKQNDSAVLMCTNDACPGKLLGKFKHFVSKKGMDIDGLSEATLEKFIKLGWLEQFTDIYELPAHYKQIINLDGWGKQSADNLMSALDKSRQNVKLPNFIAALSIPGVGEGQAKPLAKTFKTWYDFMDARHIRGSYKAVDGIGDVVDNNIRSWFAEDHNLADANTLASIVHFEEAMNEPEGDFPLLGKTFVITGKVTHYPNRGAIKEEIELLGGKCAGSISKNTDYLINNDVNSTSGKNKKAHELNIPIISEDDYLKMIGK